MQLSPINGACCCKHGLTPHFACQAWGGTCFESKTAVMIGRRPTPNWAWHVAACKKTADRAADQHRWVRCDWRQGRQSNQGLACPLTFQMSDECTKQRLQTSVRVMGREFQQHHQRGLLSCRISCWCATNQSTPRLKLVCASVGALQSFLSIGPVSHASPCAAQCNEQSDKSHLRRKRPERMRADMNRPQRVAKRKSRLWGGFS